MHYSTVNSYIFATSVEAKKPEVNTGPSCLGNISKYFSVDNIKKTKLFGYVNDFQVDYDSVNIDDILGYS